MQEKIPEGTKASMTIFAKEKPVVILDGGDDAERQMDGLRGDAHGTTAGRQLTQSPNTYERATFRPERA